MHLRIPPYIHIRTFSGVYASTYILRTVGCARQGWHGHSLLFSREQAKREIEYSIHSSWWQSFRLAKGTNNNKSSLPLSKYPSLIG